MNYQECLNYIHSLLRFGVKPGLERVSALLEKLDDPQKKCRFIHIAGTNGKGSTSTMLSAMLIAAGHKIGLYTSPFVTDFRERMQINGQYISEEELCECVEKVRSVALSAGIEATEFEFITAVAFLWFSRKECDVVVLETGLGGRFDATNVIEKPIASVIVPIGLDHTAVLGPTVSHIAAEKAGIIKEGCPVVSAYGQPSDAVKVLKEVAAAKNAPIVFADEASVKILNRGIDGTDFTYKGETYRVGMMGDHQVQNAVTAIETAALLGDLLAPSNIKAGVSCAFIPARMEIISRDPLTLLDGGHNGHAAAALKKVLKLLPKKPVAVIGMMEDKDISDYAKELAALFEGIITVEVKDNPRSISAEGLAEIFGKYNPNTVAAADYAEALRIARLGEENAMVCGSLYLAGGIRPLLIDFFG